MNKKRTAPEKKEVVFKSEDSIFTRISRLFRPAGKMVSFHRFDDSIHMSDGDELRVTHKITEEDFGFDRHCSKCGAKLKAVKLKKKTIWYGHYQQQTKVERYHLTLRCPNKKGISQCLALNVHTQESWASPTDYLHWDRSYDD